MIYINYLEMMSKTFIFALLSEICAYEETNGTTKTCGTEDPFVAIWGNEVRIIWFNGAWREQAR